jgi:Ring finger domain
LPDSAHAFLYFRFLRLFLYDCCSQTLAPTDIQRLRSDTLATTTSTSNNSGADATAVPIDSSYGDDNEADLEAAAGSMFQLPNDSSLRNDDDVVKKGTATTEECCSSDDGLSDDDGLLLEMDEFFDDSSMIILPNVSGGGNKNTTTVRQVPNGCAICLTSMDVNDRITFSSDPKCNHIFHEQCMMDWLVASGRKFLKRQRREARNAPSTATTTVYRYNCQNPIEKILSFPMQCPCCRQPFVRTVDDDDDDSLAKPSTSATAATTTATSVADQPVATSSNDDSAVESPPVVEDVESPPAVQNTTDTTNDDDVRGSQRTSIAVNDETSPTSTIAVGSDDEYY